MAQYQHTTQDVDSTNSHRKPNKLINELKKGRRESSLKHKLGVGLI
jgi:hypothetical protein